MHQDELEILIDKTATLMVQYERRGDAIDRRLHTLTEALERVSQQVPAAVGTSVSGVLHSLSEELAATLRGSLEPSMDGFRQSLRVGSGEMTKAVYALALQIGRLQRLHRLLIWKTTAVVLVALGVLLAGGAWLSLHYTRVIEANRIAADLMQAYSSADVVRCGKHLCARVDAKAPRYGERGQYVPIKAR